jgi:hypothetical protein
MKVIHSIPGRIRLQVLNEGSRENSELLRKIGEDLSALNWITHVKTSPITGTLLVNYDHEKTQAVEVVERLVGITGLPIMQPMPQEDFSTTDEENQDDVRFMVRSTYLQAVRNSLRGLDQKILRTSGGNLDLKTLFPLALILWGIKKLLTDHPVPSVPYYVLLWWGFRSFMIFNPDSVAEKDRISEKS